MWGAKGIVCRIESDHRYAEVFHSVVGGAIVIELIFVLVSKHWKDQNVIEVSKTPTLLRETKWYWYVCNTGETTYCYDTYWFSIISKPK